MKKETKWIKERRGEKIGGGWFIFRRFTSSGRVRVSPTGMPFEHPTREAAEKEQARLAKSFPMKSFCIVHVESAKLAIGDAVATAHAA